jgi:hypothetical protein
MASIEDLRQRRFALNNGSGEIPALGFGTLINPAMRRGTSRGLQWRSDSATSTVPNGTETRKRLARHW